MNFYRYHIVEYAVMGHDGEYMSSHFPNPKVELITLSLFKETEKGYWIGYGSLCELRSTLKWVSKTSKKRYAYPTKEDAMYNFKMRTEKRIKILKRQILSCEIALSQTPKLVHN